ncbi:hypothetical protein GCM10009753_20030 [Streptantibioticus ferralitis]|nr:DUF1918 domain-containing protein [Streptantibioticus ferralitis]
MHASIGDRIRVSGRIVGTNEHVGEIIEVRGAQGGPPYRVRFDDGHESLIFPGPDSHIESRRQVWPKGQAPPLRGSRDLPVLSVLISPAELEDLEDALALARLERDRALGRTDAPILHDEARRALLEAAGRGE